MFPPHNYATRLGLGVALLLVPSVMGVRANDNGGYGYGYVSGDGNVRVGGIRPFGPDLSSIKQTEWPPVSESSVSQSGSSNIDHVKIALDYAYSKVFYDLSPLSSLSLSLSPSFSLLSLSLSLSLYSLSLYLC
jgi:hypothetical protein